MSERNSRKERQQAHLGSSDRFRQVGVHTRVEAALAVSLDGRGGQGDDAEVADARFVRLPNDFGGFAAGVREKSAAVAGTGNEEVQTH